MLLILPTSQPPILLLLRSWVLQRPGVAGVILGARNASHVADSAALFSFALDDADEAAIAEVGAGRLRDGVRVGGGGMGGG